VQGCSLFPVPDDGLVPLFWAGSTSNPAFSSFCILLFDHHFWKYCSFLPFYYKCLGYWKHSDCSFYISMEALEASLLFLEVFLFISWRYISHGGYHFTIQALPTSSPSLGCCILFYCLGILIKWKSHCSFCLTTNQIWRVPVFPISCIR